MEKRKMEDIKRTLKIRVRGMEEDGRKDKGEVGREGRRGARGEGRGGKKKNERERERLDKT